MSLVSGISRTNRFSAIMQQNLNVVYESAAECMCSCPFCGGNTSLGFNDMKGLWICFRCGEKGTAKTLVEALQGVYTEPEVELDEISAELRSLERDVQSVQKYLPESYLRRFSPQGRVHQLWRDRGFGDATCLRWELGYDFLTNRLTVPFRDPFTGRLAGVFYRTIEGDGPRYQYPRGFARSSSLYGSWFIANGTSQQCVLGEGPTDAISISRVSDDAASVYGSSVTQGQIRLLHRLGIKTVVLFFDYDRAGIRATRKAEALAAELAVEKVVWNKEKYCWHRFVCGCGSCDPLELSVCRKRIRKKCRCGRIHEPDPGILRVKEISKMLGRTKGV